MQRREYVVALALTPLLVAVETLLHETVHAAINALAAGRVASCGVLGPFTLRAGRPGVCYAPGGVPALNSLVTPLVLAAGGLVAMHYSNHVERASVRWSVFTAGLYAWLVESLYSMAYLTPPTLSGGEVAFYGDGVHALDAFGWPAMLPGFVLLFLGVLVLDSRLQYERSQLLPG